MSGWQVGDSARCIADYTGSEAVDPILTGETVIVSDVLVFALDPRTGGEGCGLRFQGKSTYRGAWYAADYFEKAGDAA